MEGCEYCGKLFDGDKLVCLGFDIKSDSNLSTCLYGWPYAGRVYLDTMADFAGHDEVEIRTPIRFCPMCGRRLDGQEGEE